MLKHVAECSGPNIDACLVGSIRNARSHQGTGCRKNKTMGFDNACDPIILGYPKRDEAGAPCLHRNLMTSLLSRLSTSSSDAGSVSKPSTMDSSHRSTDFSVDRCFRTESKFCSESGRMSV